jgi:sugar O-acyltransferase (sialic acid O-acetyltransferase NeuD family)
MADIIIFGLSDFAQLAHYYLTNDTDHNVVAFTVDKEFVNSKKYLDRPVISFDNVVEKYPSSKYKMFIPMSPDRLNMCRTEKYLAAKEMGYEFISYISSKATNFAAHIGENCFILENNVIQPFCKIGNNCMLWSGNHIGHHSIIKDNCFITSHVVISGHVTIGCYTFLGVNSTVRDGVNLAEKNVIGAGALVLKDTKENEVYPGRMTEVSKVPSYKIKKL